MTRLQILELPEGPDDHRPPYVLVVDQCTDRWVSRPGQGDKRAGDIWREVADQIGACGAVVTADTIEIPSNEIAAEFREGVRESVAELYESASSSLSSSVVPRIEDVERKLSESETLGHKLLQRAEHAEAVTAHTKGLMERRTRTLRERAEAAEAKLTAFVEAQQRELADRLDDVTDALGLDRLRDWGELVTALRAYRAAAELYAEVQLTKRGE